LSLSAVRGVTNLSKKVIKCKNVDMVNTAESTTPKFVRFYSKVEGDIRINGDKKRRTAYNSIEAKTTSSIEKSKKEAYAKGYSEGIREGTENEKKRLFQAAEALTNSMRELDGLKKEILESNEDKILNLVFSVTEKVIHKEVTTNRDIVHDVLKSAVKQVLDKEGIRVRLNPEDYRYILEINPGIIDSFDDIRNMSVVEDNSIRRGGVVIETSSGEVDARLDQQLHEVRKAISRKK
jgi:flagellar assembly protein FliH